MRCPKCGYISFDHNLTCPKCNKDISGDQKRLNLTFFMPSPPPLLGALIGKGGDRRFGLGGGGMADTLRLDHLPEVSITEPEEIDAKALTEDEEEEFEIELDLDTAEMVTQELDEGHDTMSKESGEFDLEFELQKDDEDKE